MDALTGWIFGIHLVTAHVPATYDETVVVRTRLDNGLTLSAARSERRRYRSWTPGIYARRADGLTVGAYRNSFGDPSAYAGWTWQTTDGRFALTAGAVVGYAGWPVMPLIAPSVRTDEIRIGGTRIGALRLSFVPRNALHVSIERRF